MAWNWKDLFFGRRSPQHSAAPRRRQLARRLAGRSLRLESLEDRLALATMVQFKASATSLTGSPISSVTPGDEFLLKVEMKDLRAAPKGVFASWVDVEYDPADVAVTGSIEFGPRALNQQTGDVQTPGLMDEVGAFDGIAASAPTTKLLFQIRVKALALGPASFSLNPADLLPVHDTLLYGSDLPVATSDIEYLGTTVNVVPAAAQFTINPFDTQEGQTANLTGRFLDSYTDATHTLTVTWGDWHSSTPSTFVIPATNSLTVGQVINSAADGATLTIDTLDKVKGEVTFRATHFYFNDGLATTDKLPVNSASIAAKLESSTAGSTALNRTTTGTVRNRAPELSDLVNPGSTLGTLVAGQTATFTAIVKDAGMLDSVTARIDWGDGTSFVIPVTGNLSGTGLTANHVYLGGGIFNATITLTDQDTGTSRTSLTVIVTGAGLVGRTLYAVGTDSDDVINIGNQSRNTVVTANFLAAAGATTGSRMFPTTGIDQVIVVAAKGNDNVTIATSVTKTALVLGGEGNDRLQAGGGSSLLVGGDGDDTLIGGTKRNVLIGGRGADNVTGQRLDDLLIGGATTHDANITALLSLLTEWTRTDSSASRRISNLRNGGGRNGTNVLNSNTILADNAADTLTANAGTNWIWAVDGQDTIVKRLKTDVVN
jgi:hypothetical protein